MITIEVIVPTLNKTLNVAIDKKATISALAEQISEKIKRDKPMFLVEADEMEMLNGGMTVEEAGFTNATRLIFISNDF